MEDDGLSSTISQIRLPNLVNKVRKRRVNAHAVAFKDSKDSPDLSTVYNFEKNPTLILPLHPDVVVHYRCSDNIEFPNMGLT